MPRMFHGCEHVVGPAQPGQGRLADILIVRWQSGWHLESLAGCLTPGVSFSGGRGMFRDIGDLRVSHPQITGVEGALGYGLDESSPDS